MAAVGAAASIASSAMEMAGLKDPDNAPVEIPLTLQAGKDLNLSRGMPTSVVVRIYYLKEADRFAHAPMTLLTEPDRESVLLGADLIGARDITLRPGQRYVHTERVPRDAKAVGIAAFFYAPAMGGWKKTFDTARASDSGIEATVGATAMRIVRGEPLSTSRESR